jgi:hypothetical protein
VALRLSGFLSRPNPPFRVLEKQCRRWRCLVVPSCGCLCQTSAVVAVLSVKIWWVCLHWYAAAAAREGNGCCRYSSRALCKPLLACQVLVACCACSGGVVDLVGCCNSCQVGGELACTRMHRCGAALKQLSIECSIGSCWLQALLPCCVRVQ